MNIESILMLYFFPVQFAVGLIGNFLNLVVLLNRRMRSKTNMLLAMVALSDILFLIFMLPHALMYNNDLTKNAKFRTFILYGINHITGIVNTCSFASAWLIVMVSVERMMAVICPLRARCFWTWKNLRIIIIAIWMAAFFASIHSHITYTVTMVVRHETIHNYTTGAISKIERRALQQTIRPSMKRFWKIATLVNVVFVILVPVMFVVGANSLMICQLRQDRNQFLTQIKNHKRASLIVFVIATTFAICQTPSAIIFLCEIVSPNIGLYPEFRTAATLSNSLVVTGKTANHFLFCMWSSHFRKNLYIIASNYMPTIPEYVRRKVSPLFPFNNNFSSMFGKFKAHRVVKQEYSTPAILKSGYESENAEFAKRLINARYSLLLLKNENNALNPDDIPKNNLN